MTAPNQHSDLRPEDIINPEPLDEYALAGLKAQPTLPDDAEIAARGPVPGKHEYIVILERRVRDLEEQLKWCEERAEGFLEQIGKWRDKAQRLEEQLEALAEIGRLICRSQGFEENPPLPDDPSPYARLYHVLHDSNPAKKPA